ncbi:MAG TPA: hypothetical protein VMT76_15430 [Puia sp.]|nr:hypothetical protein [Puia sp.]
MKYFSHLNTAAKILQQYKGEEPFAHYIKFFFRQHRKYGSTDRKTIAHLCYCYFRLGHLLKNIPVEERILTGIFLCDQQPGELLNYFKPEWNAAVHLPMQEKLSLINGSVQVNDIFPWKEELSDGIDAQKFAESFLVQPDLFLRIRPGFEETVSQKLSAKEIGFSRITGSCLALPNSIRIEGIVEINKEVVVQDYNSQQVAAFFQPQNMLCKLQTAWDCCAASGGKSIMLHDLYPDVSLTVSDIRESILANLGKRFAEAGITDYRSYVTDLSATQYKPPPQKYDLIIADLPCSGSGTWARTPESLCFFDIHEIGRYSALQKKIISNVIPSLLNSGSFVYITCSVFKKENEEVVDFVRRQFGLQLQKIEWLRGYHLKADSMFAAVFTKM